MPQRAAIALALLVSACGGGGGGGSSEQSPPVTGGPDVAVATLERVTLRPSAASGAGVASFAWEQIDGTPVASASTAADGAQTFTAPAFPDVLVWEVEGRRADGSIAGVDRVRVAVVAPGAPPPTLTASSALLVRGGGPGRARASALHAQTERLFVVDSVAREVVVFDVGDPANPVEIGAFGAPGPAPAWDPGAPLDVAAGDSGPVAVTWAASSPDFPGRLQLVDAATLLELRAFSTTGAEPLDVDVSRDGATIAVACSGEPKTSGLGDGRGYVTLVDVPPAGAEFIDPQGDVSPIPFSAFDGSEAALATAGVRFFDPAPLSSVDLAPTSVALSPDGQRAWVAFARNNCVVTIDVVAQLTRDIAALPDRRSGAADRGPRFDGVRATWSDAETAATTAAGDELPLGGFEGLLRFDEAGGVVTLDVVSGSGPTLAPTDLDGDGVRELPFAVPDAGLAVRTVTIGPEGAAAAGALALRTVVGTPITGRPAAYPSAPGLAGHDEVAIDPSGATLAPSNLGARFAGATRGPGGEIWLAEARRPGVWRFGPGGALVGRSVPAGAPATLGDPDLPAAFARRRLNLDLPPGRRFGGFGAIAYDPVRGSVFAVPRLPLDTPDTADDAASRTSRILRVVELRASDARVVGEYALVTEGPEHAAEGLAFGPAGSAAGGALALLEAGPEEDGLRAIWRLDPDGATNLRTLSPADYASIDAALEGTAPADLGALTPPITPIGKELIVDLAASGLSGGARPSGLAFAGTRLAVLHDDGRLGLAAAAFDAATVAITARGPTDGALGVGEVRGFVFDTSVDGEGPVAADFVPVVGLDQPLDLAAFAGADGVARVALANGGLPRVVRDAGGAIVEDERVRAGDLVLDTIVFPGAASWRPDPFGGDVVVSERDADLDGDGLADRLAVFGSRSVSLLDVDGRTTWTSTSLLAERARRLDPVAVDAASVASGIAPSALVVCQLGGTPRLLAALSGAGAVAVFDLRSPSAPRLEAVLPGPARPDDIDAYERGAGALVAVTDSKSGEVRLYAASL